MDYMVMDWKQKEAWLKEHLAKRSLTKPECDPWQYDASFANVEMAHNSGIDQAISELVVPLLQENEKMLDGLSILFRFLDVHFKPDFVNQMTNKGAEINELRRMLKDQQND